MFIFLKIINVSSLARVIITIGMASCSLESQPLLSQVSQPESTNPCSLRKQVCLTTKPICLILSWTVLVGSVHFLIMVATTSGLFNLDLLNDDATLPLVIVYFFVAIILVFYPINGFWLTFTVDDVM